MLFPWLINVTIPKAALGVVVAPWIASAVVLPSAVAVVVAVLLYPEVTHVGVAPVPNTIVNSLDAASTTSEKEMLTRLAHAGITFAKSIDEGEPEMVIAVPFTTGYNVPVDDVTVPANVAFCDASSVRAVVPAPVPVFSCRMPVLSDEIARPFVALPAEMMLAMSSP